MKTSKQWVSRQMGAMGQECIGVGDSKSLAMQDCYEKLREQEALENQFARQYEQEQKMTALSLQEGQGY